MWQPDTNVLFKNEKLSSTSPFPLCRRLWVRRRASEVWMEISHLLGQCTTIAIRNSHQRWKFALDPHKSGLVLRQTQTDMVEEGLRVPCPLLQNCFLLIESERGGVSWHPLVASSGSIVSPSPVVSGMVLVKLKESHTKIRHHESRKGPVGRRRMAKRWRKSSTSWVHCALQRNCQNSSSVSKRVFFPKLECKPLPVSTSLSFSWGLSLCSHHVKTLSWFCPLPTPLICWLALFFVSSLPISCHVFVSLTLTP